MGLREEIFEQPAVLRRSLESQWSHVRDVAEVIRGRAIDYVFLAARGSSDHAGLYAKYLLGAYNRLPIALAAPSLVSIYGRPPRLEHALVLGISQSGQSPDIVNVIVEGRRQAALTLAITNDITSPLAQAAELVLDIAAGPEQAVAATKTYTAQLLAIAMLSVALGDDGERLTALEALPEFVGQALGLDSAAERLADRYRYMEQCVIIGRGYNYATAFEWALKLKELAYVVCVPYSSADFRHGPVAVVTPGFPVLAVAVGGAVFADTLSLLEQLKGEHRVELLVISDEDAALSLANRALRLPPGIPEWMSPLVSIIPAQLFAYHLTRAKGFDTETPRSLLKVTRTQ
jgi:glucosamine--fructose-6-phosphate aminotransferase (isomerizing)